MTKIISDFQQNALFMCDMLNRKFERVQIPEFNFQNHSVIQIDSAVYATSFYETLVSRIDNLLSQTANVKIKTLCSLNQISLEHSACAFQDKAIFVIGGSTGYLLGSTKSCVHRYDLESNSYAI